MFVFLQKMSKNILHSIRKQCYNVAKIRKKVRRVNALDEVTVFGEVDSVDFAIYLNARAQVRGNDVNITKIHKWLYICYGLYFTVSGKQLLTERPRAWDYGPAFPRVHTRNNKNNNSLNGLKSTVPLESLEKYNDVIDAALDNFGDWSASQLVAWTHKKGSAWYRAYNEEKYTPIDNHYILLDFEGLFANAKRI